MRRYFRLVAFGVNALVPVFSKVVREKQLVVAGAFGAVGAIARRGYKLRIALIERRVFQNKQHIRFNPELQIADRQKNPRGFWLPL